MTHQYTAASASIRVLTGESRPQHHSRGQHGHDGHRAGGDALAGPACNGGVFQEIKWNKGVRQLESGVLQPRKGIFVGELQGAASASGHENAAKAAPRNQHPQRGPHRSGKPGPKGLS